MAIGLLEQSGAGCLAIATAGLVAIPSAAHAASEAKSQTFGYTGATQSFVVPAKVRSISIVATGAGLGAGGRWSREAAVAAWVRRVRFSPQRFPGQALQVNHPMGAPALAQMVAMER